MEKQMGFFIFSSSDTYGNEGKLFLANQFKNIYRMLVKTKNNDKSPADFKIAFRRPVFISLFA